MNRMVLWQLKVKDKAQLVLVAATLLLSLAYLSAAWANDVRSFVGKEYWSPGANMMCPTLEGWTKGASGCTDIDRGAHFKIVDAVHTDDLLDPHDIRDYFMIVFDDGSKAFIYQSEITSGCCYLTEPPGAEDARKLEEFTAKIKAEDAQKLADAVRAKAVCEKKGGVLIGMTEQQVLASCWGRPRGKHTTTTAAGTNEQWVYGNANYLYFTNGILVSIQN